MKALFFNLFPFVFSMAVGVSTYVVADVFIESEGLNGLMVSVASGLLSIPFVFISYELVKSACTRRLNRDILEHLDTEAKHCVIGVVKDLHLLIPPRGMNLDEYLDLQKHQLKKIIPTSFTFDIAPLMEQKALIDRLLVGNRHVELMPPDQLRALLDISRQISLLNLQLKKQARCDEFLFEIIFNMLGAIRRWTDSIEDDETIANSHFFEYDNQD